MFNYEAIDKTPTVYQIRAIIDYMAKDSYNGYNFSNMMSMSRPKKNVVMVDLNNAHTGKDYEVIFEDDLITIKSLKQVGSWIS